MKQCRSIQDLLGPFALDELPPTEQQRVAEHLARCATCQSEFDGIVATLEQLKPAIAAHERWSPTPEFDARLMTALRDEMRRARRAPRIARRLVLVGAPATIALGFFLRPRPSAADEIGDALTRLRKCKSVQLVGSTSLFDRPIGDGTPLATPVVSELEIWWFPDRQTWLKVGDEVFVAGPEERFIPLIPTMADAARAGRTVSLPVEALVNPDRLLTPLRDAIVQGEARVSRKQQADSVVIDARTNDVNSLVEIAKRSHELVRFRWRYRAFTNRELSIEINAIRYDQSVPQHVMDNIAQTHLRKGGDKSNDLSTEQPN